MSKQPKFREVCSGHLMAMPPLPGDGQTPRGGCRYLITTCQWILVVSQPRTGPRPVSQVKALRCSTWNIPWISMHRKHRGTTNGCHSSGLPGLKRWAP